MQIEHFGMDEAILSELGARIARYRLNKNMTQEVLAREAGVSLSTLKRMELGGHATTIVNFIRILRALKLLENLELVLPEQPVSPLQQVSSSKKTRKRASSKHKPPQPDSPWTWSDDP
jgi:transcriptional regulator with XRE-family HTH domain